jgi:hypothetical protein
LSEFINASRDPNCAEDFKRLAPDGEFNIGFFNGMDADGNQNVSLHEFENCNLIFHKISNCLVYHKKLFAILQQMTL